MSTLKELNEQNLGMVYIPPKELKIGDKIIWCFDDKAYLSDIVLDSEMISIQEVFDVQECSKKVHISLDDMVVEIRLNTNIAVVRAASESELAFKSYDELSVSDKIYFINMGKIEGIEITNDDVTIVHKEDLIKDTELMYVVESQINKEVR